MSLRFNLKICYATWFIIFAGLEVTVQLHSSVKFDEGNDLATSNNIEEEIILTGLELPIPPKVRKKHANRAIIDGEDVRSLPKYVRLPLVNETKVGFEKEIEILPGINRTIKTLSVTPKIFEIEDFFDEDECDLLIELAKRKKMRIHHDRGTDNIIQDGPEKTFYAWDLNDDGFVDKEELALVPAKSVRLSVEDADDMIFMLRMDANNDGKIDIKEMLNTDLLKLRDYINEVKEKQEEKREMKTENAWIWHDDDELLRFQNDYFYGYHSRFSSITGIPEELIEESEPLLVRHYGKNQFSQCRRDSDEISDLPCCLYGETIDCRNCRYFTMEIFLNDVDEGGELVFPMANHEYSNIMNCSGEWRGYFTYAMTTGSRNRFSMDLKIGKSGPNHLFSGSGKDTSGEFDILDGIILGNTVKFKKYYNSSPTRNGGVHYSGKIIAGSRILGNWWVAGKKRLFGTFFMWNRAYEISMKTSQAKCNHQDFCARSRLTVKPKKGKAVFWYNHETDYETGMLGTHENDSLFGHCRVKSGSKWTATARINIVGDGEIDLRAWRRGVNWLQNPQKYSNILKKIGSSISRTKFEEYKDDFERFKFEEDFRENKTFSGRSENKAPSYVLNAVNMLLNAIDNDGLSAISKVVHKKLRLTCVPYYAEDKKS